MSDVIYYKVKQHGILFQVIEVFDADGIPCETVDHTFECEDKANEHCLLLNATINKDRQRIEKNDTN